MSDFALGLAGFGTGCAFWLPWFTWMAAAFND